MKTIKFRDDMINLIRRGKKTVTIRPLKPRVMLMQCPDDQKYHQFWDGEDLSKHEHGWILTQCPHGKIGDAVGVDGHEDIKLRITNIRILELRSVNTGTWASDGVRDPGDKLEIRRLWASFYAGTEYEWCDNPMVWIIDFEVVKGDIQGMENEQKPPLIDLIGRMNERIKQLHIEGGGSLSGCPCEFDREIREIQGCGQIDHSRSFL